MHGMILINMVAIGLIQSGFSFNPKSCVKIKTAIKVFWLNKISYLLKYVQLIVDCCVFLPANGCSARHSLVEFIFLMLKRKKHISLRSQPALKSNTFFAGRPFFYCMFLCGFLLFFLYFVLLVTEKSCFSIKKIDYDQCTACRAPVCWLKYTTSILFRQF